MTSPSSILNFGLPQWLSSKESACNAGATGDVSSIPASGRSPGEGHGNPLQYSCLENPMDRGAWWAAVHGVTKSWTRLKRLSTHAHLLNLCCWWCLQFGGSLNITKQWWLVIFSYLFFFLNPVGLATRKTLAYKSIFPFKINPPQYWMWIDG